MSQPSSFNPSGSVPVQKQRFSVYTMMLIMSFLALVTASLLLYYELQLYGGGTQPWNTSGAAPAAK